MNFGGQKDVFQIISSFLRSYWDFWTLWHFKQSMKTRKHNLVGKIILIIRCLPPRTSGSFFAFSAKHQNNFFFGGSSVIQKKGLSAKIFFPFNSKESCVSLIFFSFHRQGCFCLSIKDKFSPKYWAWHWQIQIISEIYWYGRC